MKNKEEEYKQIVSFQGALDAKHFA